MPAEPKAEPYTHLDVIQVALVIAPLYVLSNGLYNYSLFMTSVSSSTIIRCAHYCLWVVGHLTVITLNVKFILQEVPSFTSIFSFILIQQPIGNLYVRFLLLFGVGGLYIRQDIWYFGVFHGRCVCGVE